MREFAPARAIAGPKERLEFVGHAYVRCGFEHPETYRLIFMEAPKFSTPMFEDKDENSPGHQALGFLINSFEELKAQGRLNPKLEASELADTIWA